MREHRRILASIFRDKNLTHAKIAKAMGWDSPSTVGNKLRGERDWATGELERMCEIAGITVIHLSELSDDLVLAKNKDSVTLARIADDMDPFERERLLQYARTIKGEKSI